MPTGNLNVTEAADTASAYRTGFALGPTWSDLLLNAYFRGVIGTPPATLYFTLGDVNSLTVPTELPGMVRVPVKCNPATVNGTNAIDYQYQSSGTGTADVYLRDPIRLYCTGLGATQYDNPRVLIYDAASAGNLLAAFSVYPPTLTQVVNGDVVQLGSGHGMQIASLGTQGLGLNVRQGSYAYSMMIDWLFRGYDSFNSLFPVATYPNLWLSFWLSATTEITGIPRTAVPRTTGQWSAPAYVVSGMSMERKLVSLADITTGVITGSTTSWTNPIIKLTMSNTPQSFDDTVYSIQMIGTNTLSYSLGDTIMIQAGALEVALG